MKLNRSENAIRNIAVGFVNKLVTLVMPFLTQTIMIRTLGANYAGLRGLFTSVLTILSLAELGVGSALVYSMYQPIANGDKKAVCALLNLYKKVYRAIGLTILGVGLCMTPFLGHLIHGEYPSEIQLPVIYILYLANTVISYLLFAYKTSLFLAFQRNDVVHLISIIVGVLLNLSQILIIIILKNFYIYLLASILCTILNNVIINAAAIHCFPEYRCEGRITEEEGKGIKTKVRGLLLTKACAVSRNSFDNVFISAFLGLTATALYSNYYYILSAVSGIMAILLSSIAGGIGNSIASESVEKNYEDMQKFDFLYTLMAGWASVYMLCLYQPFITVWLGVEYTFPFGVAILFTLYFYVLKMGDIRSAYSDAKGLWWENRYRTLLETICNVFLNYLLVQKLGVYGIILATLISLVCFGFLGSAHILFREYFKKGFSDYLKSHLLYLSVAVAACTASHILCQIVNSENMMAVCAYRLAICTAVPPLLYFIAYRKMKIFQSSIKWMKARVFMIARKVRLRP